MSFQDKVLGGIKRHIVGEIDITLAARFQYIPPQHEEAAMRVLLNIIKPGFTVIDVGANIGIYTLTMGKLVGNEGRVIAFEPARESFGALIDNVHRNGLRNIVRIYQLLVGDVLGKRMFVEDGTKGTNRIENSILQGDGSKKTLKDMITLDEFCTSEGIIPDFIKIDVEGYELQVLKGCSNTLRSKHCPILCELHPNLWPEFGYDRFKFDEFLRQLAYEKFEIDEFEGGRKLVLFR